MSSETHASGAIVIFIVLAIYMIVGALLEKHHSAFGHEAGVVIVVGAAISLLAYYIGDIEFIDMMEFDETFFFYFCLPPIVFASGYNMKRKKFFENFHNVIIFGVFNTIIQFTLFSVFTYLVFEYFTLQKYIPEKDMYEDFKLTVMEILLMCSLMCSSDVVAAIAVISPQKQPKLFSLVFGEGITNDAVSIILFNTVYNFAGPGSTFTTWTPFAIVLSFIALTLSSMLIGLILGFTSALVFKHFRFLTSSPVIECNMVFCLAYIAYSISELFEFSGIITLLACGITMAHYTWYNLSNQAKHASTITFQNIGYGVEAFVFGYLGLTFFSYMEYEWSSSLFLWELLIVFCSRFGSTIGIIKIMDLFGYKSGISLKQLIFIAHAGLIRGAVAFGLVLRIDDTVANRPVIVTTSLLLVVFTTIVLGSTVSTLNKLFFSKELEAASAKEDHGTNQPLVNGEHGENKEEESEHQEFQHPNFEHSTHVVSKPNTQCCGCVQKLKDFDNKTLKPFLIYNYDKYMSLRNAEFMKLLGSQGHQTEVNQKDMGMQMKLAMGRGNNNYGLDNEGGDQQVQKKDTKGIEMQNQ